MPDENTPNPELTAEEEELVRRFAETTVAGWSQTLVTCTRRIRELEKGLRVTGQLELAVPQAAIAFPVEERMSERFEHRFRHDSGTASASCRNFVYGKFPSLLFR
jgi:hypothetical protein